jgi:hypothetical protein
MPIARDERCIEEITAELRGIVNDLSGRYKPPLSTRRVLSVIGYATQGSVLIGRCPECNAKKTEAYCDQDEDLYVLCKSCAQEEPHQELSHLAPKEQDLVRLVAHIRAGGYSFPCWNYEERAIRKLLNLQTTIDRVEEP